ncbi:MAG: DNA-formamidopyrimidine glycosylase [Patescibacteria group bacterium]
MPELPEVQTTVDGIKRVAIGKKIVDVWTDYNSPFHAQKDNIKNPDFFKRFRKKVIGAKIINSTRRAKNILIHLSNEQTILLHMKMTGHVMFGKYEFDKKKTRDAWTPSEKNKHYKALADPFNKWIHFVLTLSDGNHLVLSDMRKFGKVTLIPTGVLEQSPDLKLIGPEPLDPQFTLKIFKERINKKPNGKIKTVLMDQSLIAGIGNIYSDEVLWRTGIHPEERVSNIPEKNFKTMLVAIKKTLRKGIDFGGDSMSDYRNIDGERGKFQEYHQAYRRTHESCNKPGCGGSITRKIIGGRSAHFCNEHQKLLKAIDK